MPNAAFTALLNDVYTITNRPDLVSESTMAVRAATIKAHNSDFYPRDLLESRVQFSAADYFQALAYKTLFPRFRALSYVRKYEGGEATDMLEIISPTDIFDSYNAAKENVCYLAGEVIQIRSNTEITDILIGVYNSPDTLPDTYSSWIAESYQFAITAEAAGMVFGMIGSAEDAATYKRIAAEHLLQMRNASIQAIGY